MNMPPAPLARLAAALAVTLITAACQTSTPAPGAGSDTPSPSASSPGDPASDGATTSTGEPPGETTGDGGGSQDAGPSPATTPPSAATSSPTAGDGQPETLTIELAAACLTPGDEQTVTVTGPAGWQITVNPRYADGQMGNIYGGLALAQTIGEDGTFTHSWIIEPNTPTGPVEVLAGAQPTDRQAEPITTSADFTLADTCP